MPARRLFISLLAASPFLVSVPHAMANGKLVVFAAASLKTALDAIAREWMAETSQNVALSFAASSALARQIEQGAPADIFISADLDWMNYLSDLHLISSDSVDRLLGNEIVLIASADEKVETTIVSGFPLADLLGSGRLAIANVESVPAGRYAKAALQSLGVWQQIEGKLAQAENVRAALKLVALGEAPLGIVYRSDAHAEPAVKVIAGFPADSHPPIVYPAAITSSSTNPDAASFMNYLRSAKAEAIFRDQGFTMLAPPASN